MTELHDAFTTWLARGGRDTLPRDIALHASACPDCLSAVAAHDALVTIDLGAAPLPPDLPASSLRRARALAMARLGSGLAAVALIAAAGFVAANGILQRAPDALSGARPTPRGEGVLGGAAGPASATPSATPSPTPRPSVSESATEPASASATATVPLVGAPNPPMGGGPPPIATPQPALIPPPATPSPTPVPLTPPPAPTPTPIPATPAPTPTPVQSASSAPSASASGP
jgi:hypothetical protein